RPRRASGARHLADLEHLDEVAFLDVVVPLEADTALEPGHHLADVVLEAAQGCDLARVDDDTGPQQPGAGATADETLEDVRTGDGTQTGHTEHGSHLGSAEHLPQPPVGEPAHQALFQLVEDPVGADLDPRRLGGLACLGLGTDVEPDDHGLGDLGQRDVVLVDAADTGVDDLDATALALDLPDRVAQGLERTLGVGLDDDVEGGVLGAKLLQQTLETVPGAGGHVLFETEGLLPLGGDAAGLPVVLDDLEEVAGSGHVVPAHDLDGGGRAGLLDLVALIVDEGPGTTGDRTGNEGVALAE